MRRQRQGITGIYRFRIPELLYPLRLSVEISLRERVLLRPGTISTARIAHPSGIEPVVVPRLDALELLAEKVRALVMRRAGRDIYDVYWLLERGVEFEPGLFLQKMLYYGKARGKEAALATMERAAQALEGHDAEHFGADVAILFPAAQRKFDFAVILEDVTQALREWHRGLRENRVRKKQSEIGKSKRGKK